MRISMAVNDENGNHSGVIEAIDIELDDGDTCMRLECVEGIPCEWLDKQRVVVINYKAYPYQHYGTWVGNMIWDCMTVTKSTARELVKDLQKYGQWDCVEAHSELYDAWNAGAPITFDDTKPGEAADPDRR